MLHRLHAQPFNPFKVAAVVGEKSEVVSECGGADQEITIPNHQASVEFCEGDDGEGKTFRGEFL